MEVPWRDFMQNEYSFYNNTTGITGLSNSKVLSCIMGTWNDTNDNMIRVYDPVTMNLVEEYSMNDSNWLKHFGNENVITMERNKNSVNEHILISYRNVEFMEYVYHKRPTKQEIYNFHVRSSVIFYDKFNSYRHIREYAFNSVPCRKYSAKKIEKIKNSDMDKKLRNEKAKLSMTLLESKKIKAFPTLLSSHNLPRISFCTATGAGNYMPHRGAYINMKDQRFAEAIGDYFTMIDGINTSVQEFMDKYKIKLEK